MDRGPPKLTGSLSACSISPCKSVVATHPSRLATAIGTTGLHQRDGWHWIISPSRWYKKSVRPRTCRDFRECRVGPGNFTLSLSQIPDVILSHHPARAIARRLPPSAETSGSSRFDPVGPTQRRACPIRRVPAAQIEAVVIAQIKTMVQTPEIIVATWRAAKQSIKGLTERQVGDELRQFDVLAPIPVLL